MNFSSFFIFCGAINLKVQLGAPRRFKFNFGFYSRGTRETDGRRQGPSSRVAGQGLGVLMTKQGRLVVIEKLGVALDHL